MVHPLLELILIDVCLIESDQWPTSQLQLGREGALAEFGDVDGGSRLSFNLLVMDLRADIGGNISFVMRGPKLEARDDSVSDEFAQLVRSAETGDLGSLARSLQDLNSGG